MDKGPAKEGRGLTHFPEDTKPRRYSASPRIQELAKVYEAQAKGPASGSRRISSPIVTSRPSLHIPMSNCSTQSTQVLAAKRRVEGLPETGVAFLPSFSNLLRGERKQVEQHISSLSKSSLSSPNNLRMDGDDAFDEDVTLAEEQSLLTKVESSSSLSHIPPKLQPGASSLLQPFPAHIIFANDAYPLHLPHLDDYLTNKSIFSPPIFSDARPLATEDESKLYGYGLQDTSSRSSSRAGLEVCGAQLKVPKQAIRQRKGSRPDPMDKQDTLELAFLTKHDSPSPHLDSDEQDKAYTPLPAKRPSLNPSFSTASHPKSRLDKFPPLMLLEQDTLNELKSNAIGPRKPPGGFIGYFTHFGSPLGIVVDFVIGVEGSSLAAGIFRLQLFMDFVQLTNLNSLFVKSKTSTQHPVNKFLLFTLPSFLALNFVSIFGFAVVIFLAWTLVIALLLLTFWRMTIMYNPNLNVQGYSSQPWLFRLFSPSQKTRSTPFQKDSGTAPWRSTPWTKFTNIMTVVLLTVLYIPLGKLSLDALVWNADFWPSDAANQYATDPTVWRDPLDICYTTTMRRDEFNWAYVIVTMAAMTICFYTLWFPYQMRRTISTLLPRVPQYNELGQKRSRDDTNAEYIRLLQKDSSPLSFMYQAYKRDWGNYKPLYLLFFKFSNILVISIFVHDNCLWRKYDAKKIALLQQTILIVMQTVLLIVHLLVNPFIDEISNRSEMVSRVGYVIDDLIGLLLVLQVKNAQTIDSWLLYTVYAFTYTGNIYFAFANTSLVAHLFKRWQKRVDFSIDVFSPFLRLDMHIKRRVWQEALSTLLLTGVEYQMPLGQLVTFSVLPDDCPPYLLSFQGTAAERHIENLKIVKQVGIDAYRKGVDQLQGEESKRWKRTIKAIQLHYMGPDAYWKPFCGGSTPAGVSSFFGKAFLIPFPPTLVIRYDQLPQDQNSVVKLTTLTQLETFVWQNSSEVIQRRKWVRAVLRSLEGQNVYCPYLQTASYAGRDFGLLRNMTSSVRGSSTYSFAKPFFYSNGVLQVARNTTTMQDGYNFESGFRVSIVYDYGQRRDADGGERTDRHKVKIDAAAAFGLRDDFEWTASVQRFFQANQDVIELRLSSVESLLREYRTAHYSEAKEKRRVMSYSFLLDVFDEPVVHLTQLLAQFQESSCSEAIRRLPLRYPATMTLLLERLHVLHRSPVHRWWFLFWDDLWRLNSADYQAFRREKRVFSPQFPSSIAWTPLPRVKLEEILKSKAGLWSEAKKKTAIFTPGLLNQIYFTMEELAFDDRFDSSPPMQLGVKDKHGTMQKATASLLQPAQSSRLTGGGTDHDQSSILDRQEWPWTEQRLCGAQRGGLWQAVRRFLTLDRYTPNDGIREIWVYARQVDAGDGHRRYEVVSKASKRASLKPPRLPLTSPI